MKSLKLALAAAMTSIPCPVIAQVSVSPPQQESEDHEPSAEALLLARIIAPEQLGMLRISPEDVVRNQIEQQLLNTIIAARGAPCDPTNDACAVAARRLAAREAPILAAGMKATIERIAATHFDASMNVTEIRAAVAFLRQPAGRKFVDSLAVLTGLRQDRELTSALVRNINSQTRTLLAGNSSLLNEFYDATSHLPRARLVAPPAPHLPPRRPEGN